MSRSRLAGLAVACLAVAVLAAGCVGYHRAVVSHRATAVSHDVYVHGSSFRLGGAYYRVLYHPPSRHYYFRTRRLGHHRRYCSSFCFREDGYYYHHSGCRHLGRHVRGLGFGVGTLIHRYGPPYP